MRKYSFILFFLLISFFCEAQTVYKTKTGTKYHVSTCRYLKSAYETTIIQAQEDGLTACSVCKPGTGKGSNHANIISPEDNSLSSSNSSTVQCSGTTKAGARCKRMTTTGRCYQH